MKRYQCQDYVDPVIIVTVDALSHEEAATWFIKNHRAAYARRDVAIIETIELVSGERARRRFRKEWILDRNWG